MAWALILLRLMPLLLVQLAAAWQHLSPEALQQALKPEKATIVAFVLTSHTASGALESEWKAVEKQKSKTGVESFECSSHLKLCKDLGVVSFPAIRLYHPDGRMDRYRGSRTASSILAFFERAIRPTITEIQGDLGDWEGLGVDDIVFVGTFPSDDSNARDRYKTFAKQYRDRYTFGILIPKTAPEQSSVKCRSTFNDEEHTLTELWRVEALDNFLRLCAEPLIPEITSKNEDYYSQMGKPALHFFARNEKAKEQYRKVMKGVAKKYRDFGPMLTIVDANEFPGMLEAVGLAPDAPRGLAYFDPNTGDVFPYSGKEISPGKVEAFIQSINRGEAKPLPGGLAQGVGHDEL